MRTCRIVLPLLALAALYCTPARADLVVLNSGETREGTILEETAEYVILEMQLGGTKGSVKLYKKDIRALKRQALPDDPIAVEAAKLRDDALSKAGADAAAAWIKLGDYYASQTGYTAEASSAFLKALDADPENAAAHARLGHVKTASGWQAVNDERRQRGLVPLGDAWVKPDERSFIIDKRHEQETDELRIGPRTDAPITQQDIDRGVALKKLDDARQQERLRLAYGDSVLARLGYYAADDGFFIAGSGETPVYANGVALNVGNGSLFVGQVTTAPGLPYYYGYPGPLPYGATLSGPTGGPYGPGYHHGYSPGFVYNSGNTTFSFGTNFGGIGSGYGYGSGYSSGYGDFGGFGGYGYSNYSGYSSGFGLSLSGGNSHFRYSLNFGGGGFGGFGFGRSR